MLDMLKYIKIKSCMVKILLKKVYRIILDLGKVNKNGIGLIFIIFIRFLYIE